MRAMSKAASRQAEMDARMGPTQKAPLTTAIWPDPRSVIEGVIRDMKVKREVCKRLGRFASRVQSSQPTLPPRRGFIAQATGRAGDVLGMHFFKPATSNAPAGGRARGADCPRCHLQRRATARRIKQGRGGVGRLLMVNPATDAGKLSARDGLPFDGGGHTCRQLGRRP